MACCVHPEAPGDRPGRLNDGLGVLAGVPVVRVEGGQQGPDADELGGQAAVLALPSDLGETLAGQHERPLGKDALGYVADKGGNQPAGPDPQGCDRQLRGELRAVATQRGQAQPPIDERIRVARCHVAPERP